MSLRVRVAIGCCVALVSTPLLAGCGSDQRTIEAPPAAPAVVHADWPGCRAVGAFTGDLFSGEPPAGGSIPDDFRPSAAIWCTTSDAIADDSTPPSDDTRSRGLERRSTAISPLLDYLRQPSRTAAPGSEIVCAAMAESPVWLFLLDDRSRWFVPRIPTDACGFSLGTFGDRPPAWVSLPYTDRVVCRFDQSSATATASPRCR